MFNFCRDKTLIYMYFVKAYGVCERLCWQIVYVLSAAVQKYYI